MACQTVPKRAPLAANQHLLNADCIIFGRDVVSAYQLQSPENNPKSSTANQKAKKATRTSIHIILIPNRNITMKAEMNGPIGLVFEWSLTWMAADLCWKGMQLVLNNFIYWK